MPSRLYPAIISGSIQAVTDTTNASSFIIPSYTPGTGNNRRLVVCLAVSDSNVAALGPITVEFNGIGLTEQGLSSNVNGASETLCSIYTSTAIPANTTSADITVVLSAAASTVRIVAFTFESVEGPDNTTGTNSANGATSSTNSITPSRDRTIAIQCLTLDTTNAITTTTSNIVTVDNTQINNGTNDLSIFVGYLPIETAALTTFTATFTASDYADVLTAIYGKRRRIRNS